MGSKRVVGAIIRTGTRPSFLSNYFMFSRSNPSIYHALVVIFLEFFAWGLLTIPSISILNKAFPDHTFLMNGLIMGIKGFLSFLSAPLIGALSDLWGRKFFLLITVFFTCLPIPFMKFTPLIYFGLVAFSGLFAVTFSVIFAFVADVTDEHDRSFAYGSVTATFAFSLIISPAFGSYLSSMYSDDLVIIIATLVAVFDFIYILFFVPESLPEKLRQKSISFWENADPFASLRKAGKDNRILILCLSVFFSYLPEAGQYSCFFVYLKLIIGFSSVEVAMFIAFIGTLSVLAQTILLSEFMQRFGSKNTIMIGLIFEMLQLICYGLGSQLWVIWGAGFLAAISSITYPAISAYVSSYADADKQGLVQGIITGIRGLCNGLGPCAFGLVFNLFNVDLIHQPISSRLPAPSLLNVNQTVAGTSVASSSFYHFLNSTTSSLFNSPTDKLIPGPPFLLGAFLVMIAILVMAFIPELIQYSPVNTNTNDNYMPGSMFKTMNTTSSGSTNRVTSIISPSRSSSTRSSTNYYYKSVHQNEDIEYSPSDDHTDMKLLTNNHESGLEQSDDSEHCNSQHLQRRSSCAQSSSYLSYCSSSSSDQEGDSDDIDTDGQRHRHLLYDSFDRQKANHSAVSLSSASLDGSFLVRSNSQQQQLHSSNYHQTIPIRHHQSMVVMLSSKNQTNTTVTTTTTKPVSTNHPKSLLTSNSRCRRSSSISANSNKFSNSIQSPLNKIVKSSKSLQPLYQYKHINTSKSMSSLVVHQQQQLKRSTSNNNTSHHFPFNDNNNDGGNDQKQDCTKIVSLSYSSVPQHQNAHDLYKPLLQTVET